MDGMNGPAPNFSPDPEKSLGAEPALDSAILLESVTRFCGLGRYFWKQAGRWLAVEVLDLLRPPTEKGNLSSNLLFVLKEKRVTVKWWESILELDHSRNFLSHESPLGNRFEASRNLGDLLCEI